MYATRTYFFKYITHSHLAVDKRTLYYIYAKDFAVSCLLFSIFVLSFPRMKKKLARFIGCVVLF